MTPTRPLLPAPRQTSEWIEFPSSIQPVTAQLSLQDARYTTNQKVNWLFTENLTRIRALPDVEIAAIGLGLPDERYLRLGFRYLDGPQAKGGQRWNMTASYLAKSLSRLRRQTADRVQRFLKAFQRQL